jgi:hypothetical protein
VGHAAHIGEMRSTYNILVRKPEGRDCSEDLSMDRQMILEYFLREIG